MAGGVKERPILFSGSMVRAILEGRKTQTRRALKPQPLDVIKTPVGGEPKWVVLTEHNPYHGKMIRCRLGNPGDRLWVRETGWEPPTLTDKRLRDGADTWPKYWYSADNDPQEQYLKEWGWKRRPSIFMPRWASRITLEITAVRVERLSEITGEDAIAEGAMFFDGRPINHHGWRHDYSDVFSTAKASFSHLWDSLNLKRGHGWASNPWVWAIEFRRI